MNEQNPDPLAPPPELRKQAYREEAANLQQTAQRLVLQIEAMQRDLEAVRERHGWVSRELEKLG